MEFSFCILFIDILGFTFYQCLLTSFFKSSNVLLSSNIILKFWVFGLIIHHVELLSLGIICDNEV